MVKKIIAQHSNGVLKMIIQRLTQKHEECSFCKKENVTSIASM